MISNEPSVSVLDAVVIGAGPAGLAAALEARKLGLKCVVLEKGAITDSILRFPTQMIFFTTPELLEVGGIPLVSEREKPTRNEALKYYRKVAAAFKLDVHQYEKVVRIEQLQPHLFRVHSEAASYDGRNVVISIGYYDNPNAMNVPGEELPHVSHYYSEAHPFYNRDVVVIGGKNSAVEAALDLFRGGARVALVHRGPALGQNVKYWIRPDIENRFKNGEITPYLNATVVEITRDHVIVLEAGQKREIPAQHVFALTGYHPFTGFFEQLGVRYNLETLRPEFDAQTFETNVPGVYLAGSVVGGRLNGDVFIENGRFHGEVLMKEISRRLQL